MGQAESVLSSEWTGTNINKTGRAGRYIAETIGKEIRPGAGRARSCGKKNAGREAEAAGGGQIHILIDGRQ